VILQARPLIEWPEVVVEYVGFVAQFVATGAVGFRYAAVRDRLRATLNVGATGDGRFYAYACARAARIGLLGAIVSAILFATHLPDLAARAHTTVSDLVVRVAGMDAPRVRQDGLEHGTDLLGATREEVRVQAVQAGFRATIRGALRR